ncbi:hypothetical protein HZS_5624 [Henneguya salminicola]|nr:hypothetical protein HZS_5624 [Henneguya salminicola]
MIRQRINLPFSLPSDAAHFSSPSNVKLVLEMKMIYYTMSVPEIFYQFFFINVEYNNVLIPCVFALMERKTEIMYIRDWEKVRENVEITCQTALRDFVKDLLIHLYFAILAHL